MPTISPSREDPVYTRIRNAASRNALPHALLFTGPGDRLAAARFAAAAMECEGGEEGDAALSREAARSEARETRKPCGVCAACHKVREDIHPDVITVRDEKHKFIGVDVVREVRKDAYIRPNEGRWKIYLFPDGSLLTEQDQNTLLKLVEEGPPYAAFFFCVENPALMLQTLRSRCVEWKLRAAAETAAEAPEGWEALCRCAAGRKRGSAAELAVRLEKRGLSREELAALLERCREAFSAALLSLYGRPAGGENRELAAALGKALTRRQIMGTIELLEKYRKECGYNVGAGHVLGALAAELEESF
ncbi:DNA polymerase III subunit delta' [uncultured Oscillibacter sp.]|uniref:DNA polymerase III subunit delta' n=1 Tax=uncultured Oscillibacter sp. TaxID=876091 RepID=UPI00261362D8|nr:DNA polymerase III subunit delta' [uncultured Oscillibacter sp.]